MGNDSESVTRLSDARSKAQIVDTTVHEHEYQMSERERNSEMSSMKVMENYLK